MPTRTLLMLATLVPQLFLTAVAWAAPAAAEEGPLETFQSVFGEEAQRVRSSRDTKDDADLARRMLDSAAAATDEPALQAMLYVKAIEFGYADRAGDATAADATAALAKLRRSARASVSSELLSGLERLYRAATSSRRKLLAGVLVHHLMTAASDEAAEGNLAEAAALYRRALPAAKVVGPARERELAAKAREVSDRQAAVKKIDALRDRLDKDPDDAKAAAELVQLLIVEVDEPAEALKHADAVDDDALKAVIPLAAKEMSELAEDDVLRVADWYAAQAATASAAGAALARKRAVAYYDRFLKLHTTNDGKFLKAKVAKERAEQALARVAPAGGRKTVNLLPLIDVTRDVVRGAWKNSPQGVASDASDYACIRIPYRAPAEYDLHVEFTRVDGGQGVVLVLAHAGKNFMWTMGGWKNTVASFEIVRGIDSGDARVGVKADAILENGRRYRVTVSVRNDSVAAYMDGKLVARRVTDYSDFGPYELWDVGGKQLGVGSFQSPTVFHVVDVEEVSGQGSQVRR